jgi:hypothetical protein
MADGAHQGMLGHPFENVVALQPAHHPAFDPPAAHALNDACLDLLVAGRLEREGYERLTTPCYYRTVEELLAPLQREDSPVRGKSFTSGCDLQSV